MCISDQTPSRLTVDRTYLIQEVQTIRVESDDHMIRIVLHSLREVVAAHVEEAGAVQGMLADGIHILSLQILGLDIETRLAVRYNRFRPLLQWKEKEYSE